MKKPKVERKKTQNKKDDDNFEEGECTGTDTDESCIESSSQLSTSSEQDSADEQGLLWFKIIHMDPRYTDNK